MLCKLFNCIDFTINISANVIIFLKSYVNNLTCYSVYSEPAVPLWLEADHHSVWYQHVAAGTTDKYI